jgi:hypothetical protein
LLEPDSKRGGTRLHGIIGALVEKRGWLIRRQVWCGRRHRKAPRPARLAKAPDDLVCPACNRTICTS